MSEKHVYSFGKDHAGNDVTEVAGASVDEAKWIVGGKGANLAEMSKIGLPVPPGFSITCQTCVAYSTAGNVWPDGVPCLLYTSEAADGSVGGRLRSS